jgi:phage FluMu protein Com
MHRNLPSAISGLGDASICGSSDEVRCDCGSLLARLVAGGVELKCRRCKRAIVLPIETRESTHPSAASGHAPSARSTPALRGTREAPLQARDRDRVRELGPGAR